jgi:hypothetical protein
MMDGGWGCGEMEVMVGGGGCLMGWEVWGVREKGVILSCGEELFG